MNIYPTVLPPWMREQLTKEEMEKMQEQRLHIPIPEPMSKEEVAEESDIIKEEGRKRELIEIDI